MVARLAAGDVRHCRRDRGAFGHLVNTDITVITEQPNIARFRDAIRASLAHSLGVGVDDVSVKGKTNEGMGWIGREEGLGCIAVATLFRDSDGSP